MEQCHGLIINNNNITEGWPCHDSRIHCQIESLEQDGWMDGGGAGGGDDDDGGGGQLNNLVAIIF